MSSELRAICYDAAEKKYGAGLHPRIMERIEAELYHIERGGLEDALRSAAVVVHELDRAGLLYTNLSGANASFVAWLLGITTVDPLPPYVICSRCGYFEFVDAAEYPSGEDINRKDESTLACPICGAAMRGNGNDIPYDFFFCRKGGRAPKKIEISCDRPMLKTIASLCRQLGISMDDIDISEVDIFDFFLEGNLSCITLEPEMMRDIANSIFPMRFSDVVNVDALLHGTGTWYLNAEDLVGFVCSQYDAITTCEDLMLTLMRHEIEHTEAYAIAYKVKYGKAKDITNEQAELMLAHGLPEWYITSMKKIKYLFPKGALVEEAENMLRIIWCTQMLNSQKIFDDCKSIIKKNVVSDREFSTTLLSCIRGERFECDESKEYRGLIKAVYDALDELEQNDRQIITGCFKYGEEYDEQKVDKALRKMRYPLRSGPLVIAYRLDCL